MIWTKMVIDSFATLFPNSDDDGWTLWCRRDKNVLIDLRRVSGRSYEHWRQAIPDIECAAKGPFDLNLPYYGHPSQFIRTGCGVNQSRGICRRRVAKYDGFCRVVVLGICGT